MAQNQISNNINNIFVNIPNSLIDINNEITNLKTEGKNNNNQINKIAQNYRNTLPPYYREEKNF